MGQDSATGIGVFLLQAVLALFAFFVVAPMSLNMVSLFGVQKRFAKQMVELGVVKQEDVDNMHPKKQIAGIVITAVLVGVLGFTCYKTAPMGYLVGIIPLLLGMWKYRAVLEMNNLTVKRFRNTYKDCMNEKKYNEYVKKNF